MATDRYGIGVAIATYNGSRYLPALLDSILAQTTPVAEIVVSDDASKDDTVAIVERYAQESAVPIRLVRHERNLGVVGNFRAAFAATTAPLIAYCDQDDVWLPEKVAKVTSAFRADEDVVLVSHQSEVTDADLNPTGDVWFHHRADQRLRFPAVSFRERCLGHQIVFSRDVLETLDALYGDQVFAQSGLGECFDLGIPMAASLIGDLAILKAPLVKFRRHGGSVSATAKSDGPAPSGIKATLAARHDAMQGQSRQLKLALDTDCSGLGPDAARWRSAHSRYARLIERRCDVLGSASAFGRVTRGPGLASAILANRNQGAWRPKHIAADAASVLLSNPKMTATDNKSLGREL